MPTEHTPEKPILLARRLLITGQVQGVGFRPFVYRLAQGLGIRGWVKNVTGAVAIHAEGSEAALNAFARDLIARAPAIARPVLESAEPARYQGLADFHILASEAGTPDIHVPPDYFTCPDCLAELNDPNDRRHGYPFINCTQCGPRYTLITALPYDRPNTSMAGFALCPACRAEYEDPTNRRFHAEPIACPVCGPHLEFVQGDSRLSGDDTAALAAAVAALKAGAIVAVKGIGGYHLLCDARSEAAVSTLRGRKRRPGKPLAVMFPSLTALRAAVVTTPEAEALLLSPARPVVLLPRRGEAGLSPSLAPGLSELGVFLPYSPLHALLLEGFAGPLVATSGNLSGEPVLTDKAEAAFRLAHIADAFLHHDRPIVRPADDSVFRPIAGQPRPLRLGRGTAPLELVLPARLAEPVLALGAHSKNTVTLAWDDRAVVSPHIGDLDAVRSLEVLAQVTADLQRLYQVKARRLLIDAHPGYGYRQYARALGLPWHSVWHHRAHASALASAHPEVRAWIVFAWDGVGLGEDGTLWGGEAFVGGPGRWQRRASFRPFRLPGGERAAREPWRSAAALLWEVGGTPEPAALGLAGREREHLALLEAAWRRGLNSPASSAVGRLFDAAAALIGVCGEASYEGEAPMRLEALALQAEQRGLALTRPLTRDADGLWRADWAGWLPTLADTSIPQAERALYFHQALAATLVEQAVRLRAESGAMDVGLTGGVFQNRLLTELAATGLTAAGFRVRLGARVPVNDAGVSFGQVIEFLHTQTHD